jgi:hypothetical protein
LATILEANDGIQFLEGLDDGIWQQLKRGEILEVEADVKIPTLIKLMDVAAGVGPLLDVIQNLGGQEQEMDPGTAEALQGMATLANLTSKTPVIAGARGAPEFKFFTPLEQKGLRVELGELEGESTLVAKIHRKLRPGDSVSALDAFPGVGSVPAAQRAEMEESMRDNETLGDSLVSASAAVVTPIAIYR